MFARRTNATVATFQLLTGTMRSFFFEMHVEVNRLAASSLSTEAIGFKPCESCLEIG